LNRPEPVLEPLVAADLLADPLLTTAASSLFSVSDDVIASDDVSDDDVSEDAAAMDSFLESILHINQFWL
jgi:hypothetical protein